MKSVLLSIQPKWCELIASGEKTVEIRKTKPKIQTPFKCYIYCSKGKRRLLDIMKDGDENFGEIYHGKPVFITTPESCYAIGNGYEQKVIGEFICDYITPFRAKGLVFGENIVTESCLTIKELVQYSPDKPFPKDHLYGWHISDLIIYDKPKELNEFYVLDNEEVKKCKNRIQTYYSFTDTGYIKNGMYCDYKDDWCVKCKRKPLKRPPQSWCYVERLQEM